MAKPFKAALPVLCPLGVSFLPHFGRFPDFCAADDI